MPDNWSFVLAAYGLTAIVLTLYWHRLVRKEKELLTVARTRSVPTSVAERSRQPSGPGHPRSKPASRGPLQQ